MFVAEKNKFLLVLCLMIGDSLSVYIHDECEAKSEWEFEYRGTEINLSAWVPPGESSVVLTIEIEFEGYSSPLTFDRIILSRREVEFDRMRKGKIETKESLPEIIPEGWADVTLRIDTFYEIVYHGYSTISFFNKTVEFIPRHVKVIGSNVIKNCRSELRTWRIHDTPVYVPLDESREHFFSFFSTKEFLPSIDIETRQILIGMNDGSLTTVHSKAKPLPAFVHHQVTFSCYQKSNGYHCGFKIGVDRILAEEVPVGSKPESLPLKSKEGGHFFVFLYNSDPHSLHTETITDELSVLASTHNEDHENHALIFGMATMLGLETFVIAGLIYVVFKLHKNSRNGKVKKRNQMLMSSGSNSDAVKRIQRTSAESGVESGDESFEETNENGRMMENDVTYEEIKDNAENKESGIFSDDDQIVNENEICA